MIGVTQFVIVGHSMWLVDFFRHMLKEEVEGDFGRELKKSKIANTAVVKFNIVAGRKGGLILVDTAEIEPRSTMLVYDLKQIPSCTIRNVFDIVDV